MIIYLIIETDEHESQQSAVLLGLSSTKAIAQVMYWNAEKSKSDDSVVAMYEAETGILHENGLLNNATKIKSTNQ